MAKNLKEAIEKNRQAVAEFDAALRDCLAAIRDVPDNVVEGRFRVVGGASNHPRQAAGRQ